jgi:murein L,D-transpeptidase YafK
MNRKSDDLEAGTKSASERQLRAAAKAALRKADRFWRLAQKPLARATRNTAQNRRATPLKWRLIKHAKLTSFEQRRIKNETAPRLRAGSDTGLNVACVPQETAVNVK